ncbi:hypothetical protein LTR36_000507 [Oleoguttula mirabilis]|uniref:Uncharacterized protein n=1 Tax=Oleoguttula mirabilis TaxID=1507867 RepID=A0AAV9JRD3_9PEZI|nr:hypothetical protein LTR36_000507 [Oleoguttula mirabilis]
MQIQLPTLNPRLMGEALVLFVFTIALQIHGAVTFINLLRIYTRRTLGGGPQKYRLSIDKVRLVRWCCMRTLECVFLAGCAYCWVLRLQQQQPGGEGGDGGGAATGRVSEEFVFPDMEPRFIFMGM